MITVMSRWGVGGGLVGLRRDITCSCPCNGSWGGEW